MGLLVYMALAAFLDFYNSRLPRHSPQLPTGTGRLNVYMAVAAFLDFYNFRTPDLLRSIPSPADQGTFTCPWRCFLLEGGGEGGNISWHPPERNPFFVCVTY